MAGMKLGMKCCCHAGGAPSASCMCTYQPQPRTIAVLVWSPLAVLPPRQAIVPPVCRPDILPAAVPGLTLLSYSPLPRPPRLL